MGAYPLLNSRWGYSNLMSLKNKISQGGAYSDFQIRRRLLIKNYVKNKCSIKKNNVMFQWGGGDESTVSFTVGLLKPYVP